MHVYHKVNIIGESNCSGFLPQNKPGTSIILPSIVKLPLEMTHIESRLQLANEQPLSCLIHRGKCSIQMAYPLACRYKY